MYFDNKNIHLLLYTGHIQFLEKKFYFHDAIGKLQQK